MSNNITTFEFAPGLHLRSITKDGEPWFVCTDVCRALSVINTSRAVSDLDEDEKGFISTSTPGGIQRVLVVNESGLYSMVIRSRKPVAKPFKKWVTATVLPTIRRDGIYIASQEKPLPADMSLPELLAQLAALQAKVNAHAERRVGQWSAERCQEEREARQMGFRCLKRRR